MLVYPGADWTPCSRLRLEIIRDGAKDHEYLALLADLVEKTKALANDRRPDAGVLAEAESLAHVPHRRRTFGSIPKPADRRLLLVLRHHIWTCRAFLLPPAIYAHCPVRGTHVGPFRTVQILSGIFRAKNLLHARRKGPIFGILDR